MKSLVAGIIFVTIMGPHGNPMYVVPAQVVAVVYVPHQSEPGCDTSIITLNGTLWACEPPLAVKTKLEQAK